jgi:hypothetical protein
LVEREKPYTFFYNKPRSLHPSVIFSCTDICSKNSHTSNFFLYIQTKKNFFFLLSFLFIKKYLSRMAAPLSHPCIVDGWFMEKSTMWPGQGNDKKIASGMES